MDATQTGDNMLPAGKTTQKIGRRRNGAEIEHAASENKKKKHDYDDDDDEKLK